MFRGEISGNSEPLCPPRKATPWAPIVLVALVGFGLAHVAGLTEPLKSMAVQLIQGGSRNMRTPASRLIGDWESNDDPMFRRVCHVVPRKEGTGVYLADAGSGMSAIIYKVVSHDRSGTNLVLEEYLPRTDANYRVQYSVAKDGRSMTREYDAHNGAHVSCQYRYIGPPSEPVP